MRIHLHFLCKRRTRRAMRDVALGTLMESNAKLHEDMDKLMKLNRRREELVIAAMDLVDTFDSGPLIVGPLAEQFTEAEIAPLVRLFHAAGRHESAELLEELNAAPEPSDNEDQDHAQPTAA